MPGLMQHSRVSNDVTARTYVLEKYDTKGGCTYSESNRPQ